ncbi:MAG TPA: DUF533 domain-containing protein, partial [Xanthobacteraceae bacterium]|nr:DUF533 domain-containing protein [Xanthobacteraceae bacterium]
MFDAKRLLDQFLGGQGNFGGQGQPGRDDPRQVWGERDQIGGHGGGGFADLARQAGGMLGGGQTGGLGGVLGGLGSSMGGFGGGALAGGLAGILMGSKGGRKLAGNALTYGGLAVVGALAYKAYRDYQAGKTPAAPQQAGGYQYADPQASGQQAARQSSGVPLLPPPADTPFNPATEEGQQALGRNLLRAMIAAAKADGHVDGQEQAAIFGQMDRLNLDADDKAFVIDELRKPLDVDAV